MLANTSRECMMQTGIDYAFRHLQAWFKGDLDQMVHTDPFKSVLAAQRITVHRFALRAPQEMY